MTGIGGGVPNADRPRVPRAQVSATIFPGKVELGQAIVKQVSGGDVEPKG